MGRFARWHLDLDNPVQPNARSVLRLRVESSLGLIVNQESMHWTAIRVEHCTYWLLDSLKAAPVQLTEERVIAYVKKWRHAFLVSDRPYE